MNEAIEWSEKVPPLAENRIRYMALLIGLTIVLLAIASQPFDPVAPSNDFFATSTIDGPVKTAELPDIDDLSSSDDVTSLAIEVEPVKNNINSSGHSAVTRPDKSYRSKFNPATLSYNAVNNAGSGNLMSAGQMDKGALVTNSPLGNDNERFSDGNKDESLLTFDNLLASTGLQNSSISRKFGNDHSNISLPDSGV